MLYDSICIKCYEIQTNLWYMKYISGFLGTRGETEDEIMKIMSKILVDMDMFIILIP